MKAVIISMLFLWSFNNLMDQKLSKSELNQLTYLLEEEKLAHDVYIHFYEKYGSQKFLNISESELRHQDHLMDLLNDYNELYTLSTKAGEFHHIELVILYNNLLEKGNQSLDAALEVGQLIEKTDIKDLEDAMNRTEKEDIKEVYKQLIWASNRHLNAFSGKGGKGGRGMGSCKN
ncbi:DUF2202 domain-containing protein [Aegicerativicinus sediminis]